MCFKKFVRSGYFEYETVVVTRVVVSCDYSFVDAYNYDQLLMNLMLCLSGLKMDGL